MTHARAPLVSLLAAALGVSACAAAPPIVVVPLTPRRDLRPHRIIAHALNNPRGMYVRADGSILVAEAGTGDPRTPNSSDLLRLTDRDGDGRFDSDGERTTLLSGQFSTNILAHVRRDEVFGMAAIGFGNGTILATHAIFDGPTHLFEIAGDAVTPLGMAEGNLNSIAYDPKREIWVAASSSRNQVVRVARDGHVDVIAKVPQLENGQEPVPAYVRYDARSGEMLVSLFSGSTEGETGGNGTELRPRSAKIISVNPETGSMTDVVTGLSVPSDLVLDRAGRIYVLEFCDAFLDPVKSRAELWDRSSHGGFRRFSGRLLQIDRDKDEVVVVAEGLDAPTNLAIHVDSLFIAEGMGTPGRRIPSPGGETQLAGFLSVIDLGSS